LRDEGRNDDQVNHEHIAPVWLWRFKITKGGGPVYSFPSSLDRLMPIMAITLLLQGNIFLLRTIVR